MIKQLLTIVLLACLTLSGYSQLTNIYQPNGATTVLGLATADSINYYVDFRQAVGDHRITKIDALNNSTTIVSLTVEPITTMIFNNGKGIYPTSASSAFTLFDGTTEISIPISILPLAGYTPDKVIGADFFHRGNFTYFRTSEKIFKTNYTSVTNIQTLYLTASATPSSAGIREMFRTQNSIIFQDVIGAAGTDKKYLKRIDLGTAIVSILDSSFQFFDRGVIFNNEFYYCTPYGIASGKTYKVSDNGTITTLYTETAMNKDIIKIIGVTPNGPIATSGGIGGKEYVVISGGNTTALNHNTIANALPYGAPPTGDSRTTNSLVYFQSLDTLVSVNGNKGLWVTDGTLAGTKKIMGGVGFDAPGLHDTQYPAHFSEHCGNDLYFEGRDGVTSYRTIIYVNGINYSYQSFLSSATPREIYKTGTGINAIAKNYTVNAAPAVFKVNCTSTTGIEQNISSLILFDLYPNPNNGNMIINLASEADKAQFAIYNILGELVYSENLISETTSIKLNVMAGLYVVSVNIKGLKTTKKIIVE